MQQLAKYSALLENAISEIEFPDSPVNLYDPLRYFMKINGKRIRPALTLMAAELFSGRPEEALSAALSIEIFHNFSLIHDDIMDQAPLRRGNQTVHTKWNSNIAILSGDVLFVKAYEKLAEYDGPVLKELLKCFNKTAIEVCQGQQMDMDFETTEIVTIEEYLEMIRLKTSVLLGCALEMGAIIAGESLENRSLIYNFGQHIGIAFQIQDDILDLYADPEKFGKQVGGDVMAGKKTLLILEALNSLSKEAIEELNSILIVEDLPQRIILLRTFYLHYGIRQKCSERMAFHLDQAMASLEKIKVNSSLKEPLKELAAFLIDREN